MIIPAYVRLPSATFLVAVLMIAGAASASGSGRSDIKVHTVGRVKRGDLVYLIRHSDPSLSFHDWNLTSFVGQAVSSGLHLFSVEDQRTGEVQVGKFVIIR